MIHKPKRIYKSVKKRLQYRMIQCSFDRQINQIAITSVSSSFFLASESILVLYGIFGECDKLYSYCIMQVLYYLSAYQFWPIFIYQEYQSPIYVH